MTGQLTVDPDELVRLAAGHEVLAGVLSVAGAPVDGPPVEGSRWPSSAAVGAVSTAVRAVTTAMATRLGAHAANLRAAAETHRQQESQSRDQLGEHGHIRLVDNPAPPPSPSPNP